MQLQVNFSAHVGMLTAENIITFQTLTTGFFYAFAFLGQILKNTQQTLSAPPLSQHPITSSVGASDSVGTYLATAKHPNSYTTVKEPLTSYLSLGLGSRL